MLSLEFVAHEFPIGGWVNFYPFGIGNASLKRRVRGAPFYNQTGDLVIPLNGVAFSVPLKNITPAF